MRHDSEETRHWVEETKRRVREETHGDRDVEATRHLYDASSLADAGLHKEAIEELRVMFEEPGGNGFGTLTHGQNSMP